jgi:hypothetical protein
MGTIVHAMWVHGNNMSIQDPVTVVNEARKGNGIHFQVIDVPLNIWVHFSIPTPVMVDGDRLRLASVLIQFVSDPKAYVEDVHVWDGDKKVAWWNDQHLSGTHTARFDVKGDVRVKRGLDVAIRVAPETTAGPLDMHFVGVGCDFCCL